MKATLNLSLVRRLDESFSKENWSAIKSNIFVANDSDGRFLSNWNATKELDGIGGVYAILLPTVWFSPSRILHLHAPHKHEGKGIPFEFNLPDFTGEGYGIVYVGRTANLRQRWRGHFCRGERKDGGQVKYGMVDCGVSVDCDSALRDLRQHAQIIYTVLTGPENCVNRDILEISLCARFAPPFNIKSER
jgi:hypothetical protein